MPKASVAAETSRFGRILPYILSVGGALGLILAAILLFETIQLNDNRGYVPNCNLNPILNCGAIIKGDQSLLHGFVNPAIGLATFPILLTTGVVLFGGARLKRWYWLGLQAGSTSGIGYIAWLFYSSLYRLHAVCPYCLGIWVITITTFWYVTLYNIQAGHLKVHGSLKRLSDFCARHHLDILILIFILIAAVILKHFWYYYGQYF